MFRTVFTLVLLFAQGAALVGPQATPEKVSYTPPRVAQPLPFALGETLTYEISFSKFIFGGTIGELKLWVSKDKDAPKGDFVELRAEAISKGFFSKLFGLNVRDRFSSVVSSNDFGLHTSTKLIEEGNLRREQKSLINREAGRVTYIERDLANKSAEPKVKEAASPPWIQDLLSACYYLRTQKLNRGDVIPVPLSDGGNVYNIEIIAGEKEEVKVDAGKFQAIRLEAKVFDGRYVRRSGEMFIWVTDDTKRIPIRAKIKTSGATVNIELKRLQYS